MLVPVGLDTFHVHFVDNVVIFFVGLAVDVEVEVMIHNPVVANPFLSSYFVVTYMQLAFV